MKLNELISDLRKSSETVMADCANACYLEFDNKSGDLSLVFCPINGGYELDELDEEDLTLLEVPYGIDPQDLADWLEENSGIFDGLASGGLDIQDVERKLYSIPGVYHVIDYDATWWGDAIEEMAESIKNGEIETVDSALFRFYDRNRGEMCLVVDCPDNTNSLIKIHTPVFAVRKALMEFLGCQMQ